MKWRWLGFGLLAGALYAGCGQEKAVEASVAGPALDGGAEAEDNDAGGAQADEAGSVPDDADESDAEVEASDAAADGGPQADAEARSEDAGDAGCGDLTATIRDFKDSHPDFESFGGDEVQPGIVKPKLGPDAKPVYAASGPTDDTSGPDAFAQWYEDVDGVNEAFTITIPLEETSPGLFVYDSAAFFPIDGRGFGNQGREHNYHFTTEIHTRFTYHGGEVFTFRGDDDLWAFVNNKLAIDLGGLHTPKEQTIDFDARAEELGLVKGKTYPLDIFHAERHTVESNFRIETSIACFTPVLL